VRWGGPQAGCGFCCCVQGALCVRVCGLWKWEGQLSQLARVAEPKGGQQVGKLTLAVAPPLAWLQQPPAALSSAAVRATSHLYLLPPALPSCRRGPCLPVRGPVCRLVCVARAAHHAAARRVVCGAVPSCSRGWASGACGAGLRSSLLHDLSLPLFSGLHCTLDCLIVSRLGMGEGLHSDQPTPAPTMAAAGTSRFPPRLEVCSPVMQLEAPAVPAGRACAPTTATCGRWRTPAGRFAHGQLALAQCL
jgi:hypothetical protein